MRTSATQFELLVTYMEQHGDLSKPSSDANGRIKALRSWEHLRQLLNSDGSGDTKSTDKWKKVWSDYKNNTKKKAARLHRAAMGTGGGPANFTKLTDLETRVLNLVGVTVATGLPVEEAGLSQRAVTHPTIGVPSPLPLVNLNSDIINDSQLWDVAGPSTVPHVAPPVPTPDDRPSVPQVFREVEVDTTQSYHDTQGEVTQARVLVSPPQILASIEVQDTDMLTPSRHSSPSLRDIRTQTQPAFSGPGPIRTLSSSQIHISHNVQPLSGQTTPRRARPPRTRGSPRRRVRPAHTEQAAQQFLHSDEEWRKFKMEQHRDYMELRREQNRIRASEVEVQRECQIFRLKALDILEMIANKFCRD